MNNIFILCTQQNVKYFFSSSLLKAPWGVYCTSVHNQTSICVVYTDKYGNNILCYKILFFIYKFAYFMYLIWKSIERTMGCVLYISA